MQIEGIGESILLNDEVMTRTFPFTITYEGELIYEVVRIIDGVPLFWKEHLERMIQSLNLMKQDGARIVGEVDSKLRNFISGSHFKNNNIKIIIGNFDGLAYEYMAYYIPSFYPDASYYEQGVKVRTLSHERQNPNAKVINNQLTETVAKIRRDQEVYEIALVNKDGVITEGSRSNLFFLKDHCVHVSQGHKILKGITMLKVIELLGALKIDYKEDDVLESELLAYDACFMTSTSNNVLPIDVIDGQQFDSAHQPVVKALVDAFAKLIKADQMQYITNYKEAF